MPLLAFLHLHMAGGAGRAVGTRSVPQHDMAVLGIPQLWTLAYVAWTVALLWRGRRMSAAALLRA